MTKEQWIIIMGITTHLLEHPERLREFTDWAYGDTVDPEFSTDEFFAHTVHDVLKIGMVASIMAEATPDTVV